MKFFEFDWDRFSSRLRTWSEISRESRSAFLKLPSQDAVPRETFGADLPRLLADQFLTAFSDGQRVRLHETARWIAAALRTMAWRPLTPVSPDAFMAYVHGHFTHQELRELRRATQSYEAQLPALVCSESWLADFLSEKAMAWVQQRLDGRFHKPEPATVAAAQEVVRAAMHWSEPLLLHQLPERFPAIPPERLGRAVRLAVRLLLLFPRLRSDDLLAVIGLWPGLTARLHQTPPRRPTAVEPHERFHLSFRVEDMTALLVACASGTVRIRANDGALFAKAEQEITANLVPLPVWLDGVHSGWRTRRLSDAHQLLAAMRLTTAAGRAGRDRHVVPTVAGNQWLAATGEQRLQNVLQHLRLTQRLPLDEYAYYHDYQKNLAGELTERCRRAVLAFAQLPAEQFSARDEFLRWHAVMENPLIEKLAQDGRVWTPTGPWTAAPTIESLEAGWTRVLNAYLDDCLVPLGGVELGLADDQRVGFRLTDVGRYGLGLADRFSYRPQDAATDGELVVQPNFEIVFLAPSPLAEAALGRCAARIHSKTPSRGVGTLFKITKASIIAAAATGMTAEQVLTALRELSHKPLPSNVEREIQGWFKQCCRVTVRRAILIHCPDASAAARVVAAAGRQATLLTETVVELQKAAFQPKLVKQLKTLGVFVHTENEKPGKVRILDLL